ncbi:MAG: hypothetical protein C4B56_07820 [Candidatus Methanophagaceae archaeon]|nr:MAG: hypothetical protein C4B56_07820 [Methanophagales archaeon]
MAQSAVAVDVIGVSKRYGYLEVLRSVSLRIESGEFVALFGHNGAGKTTLLKLIATHIRPSTGTVKIFGEDAFRDSGIRRKIGLVTHSSFLYDELTVRENLLFYARQFGVEEDNFLDTVEFLGMNRWYNVRVKQLSHGLRKRADIIRALIHEPNLILLDEPFTGLDSETCDVLVNYFRGQKQRGNEKKTLLIASHSQEWVKKVCDKAISLHRGKVAGEFSF